MSPINTRGIPLVIAVGTNTKSSKAFEEGSWNKNKCFAQNQLELPLFVKYNVIINKCTNRGEGGTRPRRLQRITSFMEASVNFIRGLAGFDRVCPISTILKTDMYSNVTKYYIGLELRNMIETFSEITDM